MEERSSDDDFRQEDVVPSITSLTCRGHPGSAVVMSPGLRLLLVPANPRSSYWMSLPFFTIGPAGSAARKTCWRTATFRSVWTLLTCPPSPAQRAMWHCHAHILVCCGMPSTRMRWRHFGQWGCRESASARVAPKGRPNLLSTVIPLSRNPYSPAWNKDYEYRTCTRPACTA